MNINILKYIIHEIDNKNEEMELSETFITLGESPEFGEMLKKHITNSLNDEKRRIAKFINGNSSVLRYCNSIFTDDESFVDDSKEITKKLELSMKNKNISPAYLLICLYTDDDGKKIAILKLDFNKNVRKIVTTVNGMKKIFIEIEEEGLPGPNQKLQKCAFVSEHEMSLEDGTTYDLILLDRQNRSADISAIANFFAIGFLESEFVLTSKDQTKKFKKVAENYVEGLFGKDSDDTRRIIRGLYSRLDNDSEIDVISFARDIFGDGTSEYDNFIKVASEKVGDFSFNIDHTYTSKVFQKIMIDTKTGFEIKTTLEGMENRALFSVIDNEDGSKDITLKNTHYEIHSK